MRVQGIALALSLTMATAAGAQSSGAFEINGFGRYTKFDDTLSLDDNLGGGGSLGIFLLKNLALEAEGAYTKTDGPLGTSVYQYPPAGTTHLPHPPGGLWLGDSARRGLRPQHVSRGSELRR